MKNKNNRKVYLINPRFQWRFIGFMMIVSFAGIFILFSSNLLFFRQMNQEALEAGIAANNPFFDFISEQSGLLTKIYLVSSLVAFVVIMSFGLFYSHRIAGPLYQLNKKMKSIAEGGEIEEVHFRKNDLFLELEDSFNKMMRKIKITSKS